MENNTNNRVTEPEANTPGLTNEVGVQPVTESPATAVEEHAPFIMEEVVSEESSVVKSAGNKRLLVAVGIVLVGALIAGGYYFFTRNTTDVSPVAVVNNIKIARAQFNDSVAMITQTASLQGADLSDPEVQSSINSQAVNLLIDNSLLIQGAKEAGFEATDEQVQSEYDTLVEQLGGVDALNARMTEVGLTEEKLRQNISEKILVDAYLTDKTDIENVSATDEEITSFYDSLKAQGGEVPPLADVKAQIEAQIIGQKKQTIVADFLATLREGAKIEVLI